MLRTFEGKDVPQKPTKKYENGVGVGKELIRIVIEDLYGVFKLENDYCCMKGSIFTKIGRKMLKTSLIRSKSDICS